MMQEITAAIDEAFHIPDVRIWLRKYAADNVAQDGHLGAEPVPPLCLLEAPELQSIATRRTMANKIMAAITETYKGLANTGETLILMNHHPLENAGFAGRLQSAAVRWFCCRSRRSVRSPALPAPVGRPLYALAATTAANDCGAGQSSGPIRPLIPGRDAAACRQKRAGSLSPSSSDN